MFQWILLASLLVGVITFFCSRVLDNFFHVNEKETNAHSSISNGLQLVLFIGLCVLYRISQKQLRDKKPKKDANSSINLLNFLANSLAKLRQKKLFSTSGQRGIAQQQQQQIEQKELVLTPLFKSTTVSENSNLHLNLPAKIYIRNNQLTTGGRHHSNSIVLKESVVSRYHFQISCQTQENGQMKNQYFLQDLGSVSGTFLYLSPQEPYLLKEGMCVKAGDSQFGVKCINTDRKFRPLLQIFFFEGPSEGVTQTIGQTAVTIGRNTENTLCVPHDPTLSAHHCRIFWEKGCFYVIDLDSTNGTGIRLLPDDPIKAQKYSTLDERKTREISEKVPLVNDESFSEDEDDDYFDRMDE